MVDANGELKPFDKFLNDVQSIEKRYNSNYLRAEYNFAVASAQSASQWEQIAADGDRFDLQYRTAGDSKVRPTHAALNGVTLPPSSPFWDSFMPPNGWNCRCTAVQVRRGKYPNIDVAEALALGEEATADDKRGILRFNPGKLGKTFPDYNPYTISRCRDCDVAKGKSTLAKGDVPESDQSTACSIVRKSLEEYEIIPTKKGFIRVHREHGVDERAQNIETAKYFAEKYGHRIDLIANPNDEKSPDAHNHTLGHDEEYKVSTSATKTSIDNLLRDGAKQSNYVVLRVKSEMDLIALSRGLRGRANWCTKLELVTIIKDGKDVSYTRAQIMGAGFEIKQEDFK